MSMLCKLLPEGSATRVDVIADVQLSGSIAQFGRTGLLTEIANQLVAEFVKNAETELGNNNTPAVQGAAGAVSPDGPGGSGAVKPLNTTSLFLAALKAWFASFFKKTP
jgi:hypothetical protein